MAVEQASDLLTIREAASYLKVSPVTVKRYVKSGRLRAIRLSPRAVRIRRAELERLLVPAEPERAGAAQTAQHTQAPSQAEVVRRRAVVEQILARRTARGIAPVTSVELVRRAREKATSYER